MNDSTSLLESFSTFIREKQEVIPFSFNVLDEQCGHILENSHTNILMKLLQYKNRYGYVFLESFFSLLGLQGFEDFKWETTKGVHFITEKFYDNCGRIDGLIYQKNAFALIIENKVNRATNQTEQLKKYIEAVSQDKTTLDVDFKQIWVLFLTLDGRDTPDKKSETYIDKKKIHYFEINYQEDILPWLKEEIQPFVMRKERVLDSGLSQYVDFLEGMLGLRQSDQVLLTNGRAFIEQWIEKKEENFSDYDFEKKNSYLDNTNKSIRSELKRLVKSKDSNASDLRHFAGILHGVLDSINDEPMKDFFDFTRKIFVSKGMEDCIISHIFNYYYIQIRDASWPRSIHFEWYPLGVKKLTSKKKPELRLCLHIENPIYHNAFQEKEDLFKSFSQEKHIRTLSFCHKIEDSETTFPIIGLRGEDMEKFLSNVYSCIEPEMIKQINEIIDSVKKKGGDIDNDL